MLVASVFSHIALGALLSLFFTLYYVNGDGKWKLFLEIVIGAGGNVGAIFLLDNWIKPNDIVIRMYSIGSCILSFLVVTFVLCTSQQKLDTNFKYYLSINLISVQYGASFATFLSG